MFWGAGPEVLEDLEETTWDRVLAGEPLARPPLNEAEFDNVLEVLADISDLKSPWFSGHSRGVGDLAAAAVRAAGLPPRDATTVRRAGLVHDIGRTGVANNIWDKPGRSEERREGKERRYRLLTNHL